MVSEPRRVRGLDEEEKMSSDDEETKKAKAAVQAKALVASEGSGKPLMMMSRTSSVPIQYPMLTNTNYIIWATKMKFILRNLRVWKAIEGDGAVDDEVAEGAMASLS